MTENNEKILKVALIGIGGMGYCHYCCYDSIPARKSLPCATCAKIWRKKKY